MVTSWGVLAGAVQDFMVLFISSRRNGASLGKLLKRSLARFRERWRSLGAS